MSFDLIKAITDKCYAKNAENSEIGRQKQRSEATVTVLLPAIDYIHILYSIYAEYILYYGTFRSHM